MMKDLILSPKTQNQGKEATLPTPVQVAVLASPVHQGKERPVLERKKENCLYRRHDCVHTKFFKNIPPTKKKKK